MTKPENPTENNPEDKVEPYEFNAALAPLLGAVGAFSQLIGTVPWFTSVGTPLTMPEEDQVLDYLAAMGFPDAHVMVTVDPYDVEEAAMPHDHNSALWEAEEYHRAALVDRALAFLPETELEMALSHIQMVTANVIEPIMEECFMPVGLADDALQRAAMGSAVQACYNAALVLIADEGDDHPLALKYKLFETGHWPIGLTGNSFFIA